MKQINKETIKNPEKYIVPVDCMFADFPEYRASGEIERRILNGCTVPADVIAGKTYRVYGADGRFLCLSEGINPENPCLKLKTAFFGGC